MKNMVQLYWCMCVLNSSNTELGQLLKDITVFELKNKFTLESEKETEFKLFRLPICLLYKTNN